MKGRTVSLLVLFTVALSLSTCLVNASDDSNSDEMGLRYRKTRDAFVRKMRKVYRYHGRRTSGVSRARLRMAFNETVRDSVKGLMAKSFGGSIEEIGDLRDVAICDRRPTLTMEDVIDLAQQSFNITEFEPAIPPCENGGKVLKCNYDTGNCCQRPQVEFIGRYYDTAIAAMALGATQSEAFAPVVHARALAYTLEACDPDVNYKGNFEANTVSFLSKWDTSSTTEQWQGSGLSLISFPQSYEVFYELYNTMLIERLKSRANTQFPSHEQMKVLREKVYYKKLLLRVVPLDIAVKEDLAYPSSDDFAAAGMTMVTSEEMATSRLLSVDSEAPFSESFNMSSMFRQYLKPISVYEKGSKRRHDLDLAKCNRYLDAEDFFQFKVKDSVWNKYEACCAKECDFLAKYGGTFSAGSENCCAGCNRASCSANTAKIAELLAEKGAIESPSKTNEGAVELTIAV